MTVTSQGTQIARVEQAGRTRRTLLENLVDAARCVGDHPIAVLSAFGEIRAVSAQGISLGIAERRLISALNGRVVTRGGAWRVGDLLNDPELAALAGAGRSMLRTMSAWPLRIDGFAVGSLMLLDVVPRLVRPRPPEAMEPLTQSMAGALAIEVSQARDGDRQACADAVFEEVPDGLLLIDEHGRIERANRAAVQLLGLPAEADPTVALCVDARRGIWVESDDPGTARLDPALLAGHSRRLPAWRHDGGKWVAEIKVARPSALAGGMLVVLRDVTQLDEARQLLELHALIVDKTESAVLIIEPTLGIEWCNPGFERLSGYSLDELAHTGVERFFATDQAAAAFAERLLAGEPFRDELSWTDREGGSFDIALEVHPIFDGTGLLSRAVALGFDVTEQRRRSRQKSDFVSMVSHELRAPLTVIRGTLDALGAGMLGALDESANEILELGQRNCQRLASLIEDLLDVNQIESGVMRMCIGEVSSAMLVRDAIASMRAIADEAGVGLRVGPIADPGLISADPRRVTQVLVNLLGNAIKFSPVGKTVEISSRPVGTMLRVSVADQGPGIPNAFKPRLFELFSRDPEVAASGKEGFGLGLCISKGLIERMGGSIGFDSEQGIGSTFYFDLPLAASGHGETTPTTGTKDLTA
ncbi:MAG: ATP-binding protein [Burkholderiaceae bacterium]